VTLLEVFGGLALLAGVCVALASVPLFGSMLVAMGTIHWRYGFSAINTTGLTPDGPTFGPPGYEVNLLYMGALFALIVAGAGPLSIDGWIARRRRRAAFGSRPPG
jgi:putative oxidoreductase